MKKNRVTITIDQEVNDLVKEASEKEERSFSQMVNKILKEYLKTQESK